VPDLSGPLESFINCPIVLFLYTIQLSMQQVWLFLGIYFAILLGISFWGRRKSSGEFILAERKLGNWAAANSLAATAIGGGLLLVGGAYIYQFGIGGIFFFIGKIIGYILLTIFISQIHKRVADKKYNTLADYFGDFHGKYIHQFVAGVIAVTYLGWCLVGFVGGAGIIVILSGISFELAAFVMLGAILLYTIIGGFRNVIRTDYIQWIAIFVVFLLFFANFSSNLKSVEAVQWDFFAMSGDMIAAFFLVGVTYPFSAMEVWQRMFALEKSKKIVAAMTRFGIMYLIFGIVLCLIIMIIRTFDTTMNPDFAIVEGIVRFFPPTFVALGTVAFFAAIMSSLDSYLFVANATVVHDFFDPQKKLASKVIEKKMRWTLLVLGILTLCIGFVWRNIVDIAVYFSGITVVISMLVFFSWIWRKQVSENALIFCGTLGLVSVTMFACLTPVGAMWLLPGIFVPMVGLLFWYLIRTLTLLCKQKI
jgi:Na+/proline symporter